MPNEHPKIRTATDSGRSKLVEILRQLVHYLEEVYIEVNGHLLAAHQILHDLKISQNFLQKRFNSYLLTSLSASEYHSGTEILPSVKPPAGKETSTCIPSKPSISSTEKHIAPARHDIQPAGSNKDPQVLLSKAGKSVVTRDVPASTRQKKNSPNVFKSPVTSAAHGTPNRAPLAPTPSANNRKVPPGGAKPSAPARTPATQRSLGQRATEQKLVSQSNTNLSEYLHRNTEEPAAAADRLSEVLRQAGISSAGAPQQGEEVGGVETRQQQQSSSLAVPAPFKRAVAEYEKAWLDGKGICGGNAPTVNSLCAVNESASLDFMSNLHGHYTNASSGRKAANTPSDHLSYATFVAVKSWLIQALFELSKSGKIASGVSVTNINQLLKEVSDLQEEWQEKAVNLGRPMPAQHSVLLSPKQPTSWGLASHTERSMSEDVDLPATAEEEEEAIRWRNRWMRNLFQFEKGATSGDRHIDSGPWAFQRPIGIWLPQVYWSHLTTATSQSIASECSEGADTVWQVCLPASKAIGASVQPVTLASSHTQSRACHARSLLQLQNTLFHLHLELAASALMSPTSSKNPYEASERHLTKLRLACSLTSGSSWNSQCLVSEPSTK